MLILSIETSCDETSLALLYGENIDSINKNNDFVESINSWEIVAQLVSSQIIEHQKYGGVVPEIGARMHASQIYFLLDQLFKSAVNHLETLSVENSENTTRDVETGYDLIIKSFRGKTKYDRIEWSKFLDLNQLSIVDLQQDPKKWLKLIDQIYVTTYPGLPSALRVGVEMAKTIVYWGNLTHRKKIKIHEINHLHGHIASCFYTV
jgi:tRNA A37 threonylcarbamoyltransferase TsaD